MTKLKFTTKTAIALSAMLCAVFSNAQAGIIPIPIPIYSGGGGGSREGIISLWLAMNLFFIIYFLIRAIIYPMIKNKVEWTKKWYQFILTDSFSYDLDMNIGFAMCTFFGINGIAILFATANWIGTFLK